MFFFFFFVFFWCGYYLPRNVFEERNVAMMKGFTYKGRWCRKQYTVNDGMSLSII